MTFREKLLCHHNHPVKVVVDAFVALAVAVLLWQQHVIRAAALGLLLPAITSAGVLWLADLQTQRRWQWGCLHAATVTPTTMLVRVAGVFVFWGGAWYRSPLICLGGIVVIAHTWVRATLTTEPVQGRRLLTSAGRPFTLISRALERHPRFISGVLLFLSLANVVVFYLGGHSFRAYVIENSDLLYLPTLFSDLLSKGGRLSDWFLTPAPYFFPDYPEYFAAFIVGAGTYSRTVIFAVAQTLLTFYAIWLLARQVSQSDAFVLAVTAAIGLMWCALNVGEPFVILFASASHYGSFISAIILAALWMQYRSPASRPRKGVLLFLICVLAFLSALSDNLFIVHAIVPFCATSIIAELSEADVTFPRARFGLIAAWAMLTLVVPALMYRTSIPPPSINVAWSPAIDDERRAELETRFHLTEGDFRGGRLWTYRIADTTRANVGALVADPDVEDTQHIDRGSFTVDGASGPLWRAVSTLPIGLALSTAAVLGMLFARGVWNDVRRRRPVRANVVAWLPAAFSVLGSASYNVVVSNPTRYPPSLGLEKTYANLTDLYSAAFGTIRNHPIYGTLCVVYLGLLMWLLYRRVVRRTSGDYPQQLTWVVTFATLSLCSTALTASLMTDLPVMPRYLIPAFSWPVIIVALCLGHHLGQRVVAIGTFVSMLAVVSLSVGAYALTHDNGLNNRWYSGDLKCIDDVLEREALTNGIAQYWDAKYIQQFSRLDLNIAQYLENLEEMRWITSKRYFRDTYDFAIVSENAEPTYRISSETLASINGAPRYVVSCGNRSVYVYGKDRLRTIRQTSLQ